MVRLSLLLCFILFEAMVDADHIKKGQYIKDHKPRWFKRATFILALALVNNTDLLNIAINVVGCTMFFASMFDFWLNIMLRKEGLFYLGTEASWDKLWNKHLAIYKALVISALPTSIYIILTYGSNTFSY